MFAIIKFLEADVFNQMYEKEYKLLMLKSKISI